MPDHPFELRPRLPATLAAAQIGVWEYDVAQGKSYLDDSTARMLGLPPKLSRRGVPFALVTAKVHAADHIVGGDGQLLIAAPDRVFTHILRYAPCAGIDRCAIAHGSVEVDGAGRTALIGGVMIDVTDRVLAGGLPQASDNEEPAPLVQAIDAALCAHQAIKRLGSAARPSLLHVTELLLHELGMQLARELR